MSRCFCCRCCIVSNAIINHFSALVPHSEIKHQTHKTTCSHISTGKYSQQETFYVYVLGRKNERYLSQIERLSFSAFERNRCKILRFIATVKIIDVYEMEIRRGEINIY